MDVRNEKTKLLIGCSLDINISRPSDINSLGDKPRIHPWAANTESTRYCAPELTDLKRQEIEKWRQDISWTTDATQNLKTPEPKRTSATFFWNSHRKSIKPERGFVIMKIPKDIQDKDKVLMASKHLNSSKGKPHASQSTDRSPNRMSETGDIRKVYSQVARLSLTATSDRSSAIDPDRCLITLEPMTPLTDSSVYNESLSDSDRVTSHATICRSLSNELLNMITIDDTAKEHRDHYMTNLSGMSSVTINDLTRTVNSSSRTVSESRDGSADISQTDHHEAQTGRNVRNSAVTHTLESERQTPFTPSTKFSMPSLRSSDPRYKSTWHSRASALASRRNSSFSDSAPGVKTTNAMWRTIDNTLTETRARKRSAVGHATSVGDRLQSARFNKMNAYLRKQIDRDSVSDRLMSERVRQYRDRHPPDYRSTVAREWEGEGAAHGNQQYSTLISV